MWSFLAVFCSSRWMELRTDFNISQLNSEFQYISFGRGTTDIKSIILITIDLVLGKMLRTRRNENATKRSSVVAQCTNALLLIFRDIFFPTKLQSWRVKARVYFLSNTFPGFEDRTDSVFIQHRRNVSNFVSLKNTHSTNLTSLMNFRVTLTRNFSVLAGAVCSSGTNETQTDRLAQLCRTNFVSPYSNSASVVTIQI